VLITFAEYLQCLQDYKDDNHKPEMALALEDFEALCGFVSSEELKQQLQQQPELRLCVGEEAASAFVEAEGEQAKPVSGSQKLSAEYA
jgi:mannose-6-phosphate isomerase class I